jgi:hypothetical protein
MNSSQQQFLNKGKKASVKNPNTEADPVPFALFLSEFQQSPTGDAEGVWSFFKVQKEAILTNVCFSTAPMDFFAFSHGFQLKKLNFHSETTRTPFGLPTRNLHECRANFSKIRLLCFVKAVKIINSAPLKKFQRFCINASSGFLKRF